MNRIRTSWNSGTPTRESRSGGKGKLSVNPTNIRFSDILSREKTSPVRLREKLGEMLDVLEETEEEFVRLPQMTSFFKYRAQLRSIASFLLENGYALKKLPTRNNGEYEVVSVIDQALSEIYQSLNSRRDEVALSLRWIGEIRGLLLDVLR